MIPKISLQKIVELVEGEVICDTGLDSFCYSDQCPVEIDTRKDPENRIFVALKGSNFNSHESLIDIVQKKVAVLIIEDIQFINEELKKLIIQSNILLILVRSSRKAYSQLCGYFYNYPSKLFTNIGVTGTNGKTTTSWMIKSLLGSIFSEKTFMVGTLGVLDESNLLTEELINTTPNNLVLNRLFKEILQNNYNESNYKYCVMEVSSVALDQFRTEGIDFNVAAYTNLTQDHLDYHENMESYFLCKKKLFDSLKNDTSKCAVINIDDQYGLRLYNEIQDNQFKIITYGMNLKSNLRLKNFLNTQNGSEFEVELNGQSSLIKSNFSGLFNAYNLVAAIATLIHILHLKQKDGLEEIISKVNTIPDVPGRLERYNIDNKSIFVDYAHTPDALKRVLESLREILNGMISDRLINKNLVKPKLWCIFGCGGNRDKSKRPIMGWIAAELADFVILTNDNPRNEDPHKIVTDIIGDNKFNFIVNTDRKNAIEFAIEKSDPGDIILIAGKGHENYQICGDNKKYFSDSDIVKNYKNYKV